MVFSAAQSASTCSADGPAEPVVQYIRQARRLRHLHRHNPVRLHQSLRELNGVAAPPRPQVRAAIGSAAAVLSCEVEEAMDGPVLRYDERSRLLRRAQQLGLGRFEANLLIATVQHHRRGQFDAAEPGDFARRPWGAWQVLTLSLIVEAAALVAGWWAMLG